MYVHPFFLKKITMPYDAHRTLAWHINMYRKCYVNKINQRTQLLINFTQFSKRTVPETDARIYLVCKSLEEFQGPIT